MLSCVFKRSMYAFLYGACLILILVYLMPVFLYLIVILSYSLEKCTRVRSKEIFMPVLWIFMKPAVFGPARISERICKGLFPILILQFKGHCLHPRSMVLFW